MVNFPLPVKATMSDEFKMATRIVQFGDRYKERAPDGLNRPMEVWNVEVAFASETAGANLQAFLVEHGQWKPFKWQSPRDTSPQDYCIKGNVGGSFRRGGGSKPVFFTRTLKFERVWDAFALPPVVILPPPPVVILPPPAPAPPNVSVVANGLTGWTISRSGVVTNPLVVSYSLSVTADSGSASTTSNSATILAGTSSVFVPIDSSPTQRTELLSIVAGSGYTIGSLNSATILVPNSGLILDLKFNPTSIIDTTGKIVSTNGSYSQSPTIYNGLYSGIFNGTDTWALVAPSNDWNLNNTDLTIEALLNQTVSASADYPFSHSIVMHGTQNNPDGWFLQIEANRLRFYNNDIIIVEGIHTMARDTWNKVAYTQQSFDINAYYRRLFVNDIKIAETISTIDMSYTSTRGLSVGCHEHANGSFYNGFLNELKIYKSCLYV